jgi:UDP-N-acetylmuramyl pentapeptide phosphotransferase/UDP-N-acetylglucosamine-1-phosphate transferase
MTVYPYSYYLFALLGSLCISLFSIPNIIYIARRKRLFDVPDNQRKLHTRIVPNLGGVGIFFAFFITASLCIKPDFITWNYVATACLILFITGLKDDLVTISPSKKFIAQAAAAAITVIFADVRLHSLGGLFGFYELPYWASVPFSIIGCIFVSNAFNLIDGIDGLAGTIGVYISMLLGLLLAAFGNVSAAVIAFSLSGALLGFLRSNLPPARIFMGDTGSLLIGFVVSVLSILVINAFHVGGTISSVVISSQAVLVVTLSVLFLPVFDTFRVFTMRILRGHSPFRADRTHLHHYMLDIGLSHGQAVGAILTANILLTTVAFTVQSLNINVAVAILLCVMLSLYSIVVYLRRGQLQIRSIGTPAAPKFRPALNGNGHISVGIDVPQTVMVNGKPIHLEEMQMEDGSVLVSDMGHS